MSLHIVIDGYNLIRQSPALLFFESISLEEGRDALIERLIGYKKFRAHAITVVFDGAEAVDLGQERIRQGGIDIVYSCRGESADTVIKRMAAHEGGRIVVVTSDREVASYAVKHGATAIDSQDFERKMQVIGDADPISCHAMDGQTGWRPSTKKKGPARRRSKRERRNRIKTKKL
jgi:predicted RNA-binding protein with PIN domain